jgi:hypothetical protein
MRRIVGEFLSFLSRFHLETGGNPEPIERRWESTIPQCLQHLSRAQENTLEDRESATKEEDKDGEGNQMIAEEEKKQDLGVTLLSDLTSAGADIYFVKHLTVAIVASRSSSIRRLNLASSAPCGKPWRVVTRRGCGGRRDGSAEGNTSQAPRSYTDRG